ncbi:hypothetical protein PR048_006371, partial [Dryococelus australis]
MQQCKGARRATPEMLPDVSIQKPEDSHEATDIRKFRDSRTRNSPRQNNMSDLFLRLMASSDPYLSALRKLPRKSLKSLTSRIFHDLKQLLQEEVAHKNKDDEEEYGNDEVPR